jgi:hypothetical protein
MGAMRKVFAWLGAATLYMLVSVRAEAANDVLKPYVVLILDTSDSMLIPTGSGPSSCGKVDNRLNHAVCAIHNIVESYGDMVFALGRYRETSSGTFTTSCDLNGDQDGNAQATLASAPGLIAPPGGGDQCNTQGAVCGDCNSATGTNKICTVATQITDCLSDTCNATIEPSCTSSFIGGVWVGVDDDNDGFVNDGCPIVGAAETNCNDNIDNDNDNNVNDGCPTVNQCGGTFGCTNADRNFELLAPLVDGSNAAAGKFVDGTCSSCDPKVGDAELWGVGNTFTPVSGTLLGAKRYWEGRQATDLTQIWDPALAGYDPINRDPSNNVFLTATATATCSANPTSCVIVAETNCGPAVTPGGSTTIAADDDVTGSGVSAPDGTITDGCPQVGGAAETGAQCSDAIDNDNDGMVNDGCPSVCTGSTCCCAQQCRPYITIMLADGDETCTAFSNTTASAASMLDTRPHSDAVGISALSRNGTVATATSAGASQFAVGDSILVSVPNTAGYNVTLPNAAVVQSVVGTTITYNDARAAGTASNVTGATVAHVAGNLTYRVVTKPIGFGVIPGTPSGDNIEALAHAGGAPDLPGVNEGYYANDEADLQLAISDILSDSVRSELCNSKDDDCDTRIDEDFPQVGGTPPGTPAQTCPALCDTDLNPITPKTTCLGRCAANGTFQCDGTGGVTCNAVPAALPGANPEVCNNIDDDCDGLIDEGLSCNPCVPTNEICNGASESCGACPVDTTRHCSNDATKACVAAADCPGGTCSGACTGLTRACAIGTGVGVCSGVEQCVAGSYSSATCSAVQGTEACDGIDNDCDGICDGIDLDCSTVGGSCNPNDPASCPGSDNPGSPLHNPPPRADGKNVCRPGQRSCAVKGACTAGNSFSACVGEVLPCVGANCDGCDGLDNDCDNNVDENFAPSDCSNNCGLGTTQCVNGQIKCNSAPSTNGDKTCNNIDDDCDNVKDEDWMCGDPTSVPFVPCACGAGVVCDGVSVCSNGAVQCQGGPINTEVCNCLDDDCDGTIDEDPTPAVMPNEICPGGSTCVPGSCQCAFGCVDSEFPCPVGKKCDVENRCNAAADEPFKLCTVAGDCPNGACEEAKFCVNDPCFDITCAPVNGNLTTCQPKAGFPNEHECVDVCSLINDSDNTSPFTQCAAGFVCVGALGECRPNNCTTFPDMCTATQSCVNGSCVSNPCSGVTCDSGKYCLGGTCVPSCSDVTCATGQRCRQGVCEPDPCSEHCPFGEVCNDSSGQCIEDPCKVRNCPSGQWCNPNDGQCEDDPCVTSDITCPNAGEVCRGGTCVDPDTLRPDAAGESHVTVGGGGGCSTTGGGSGLLLALGLLLVRRRRHRSPASPCTARDGGAL